MAEEFINQELFIYRKGTKYYRIINGVVQIIRIINIKNQNAFVCMRDEFYKGQKSIRPEITFTLNREDLAGYNLLLPAGQICLTNVKTTDGIPDVLLVAAKIETDSAAVANTAASVKFGDIFAICRQVVVDIFAYMAAANSKYTYVGLSISRKTCPANIIFENIFANCVPDDKGQFINIYQQDNIDQILGFFKTSTSDEILMKNTQLIKDCIGVEKSVEDLVKNNEFIHDIQAMFDIIPMNNVTIKYEDNMYILSDVDLSRMEYVIKCRMKDIVIMEYTHFISEEELSEDYAHIKIVDSTGKLYIVQYTPVPGFAENLYPESVRDGMSILLDKYNQPNKIYD